MSVVPIDFQDGVNDFDVGYGVPLRTKLSNCSHIQRNSTYRHRTVYIYTLKLKIYISNRIHTNRNYTYEHRTACMYIEPRTYTLKLHIYTSNQIHIHRNYTYIYIEPNTRMPELHIYRWYRSNKSKCIRTYRNNPFSLRTVCSCTSSYFIWSIEP